MKKVIEEESVHLEGANRLLELPEFSSLEVAKNFLNILDEKFTNISCVERDFFVVSTNRDGIKLSMYTKDSDAKSYDDTSRNELVAKGIILNFFLKAFEIDDASPIDEIQLEDALNNMSNFDKRVEALASRLLIPKKEFLIWLKEQEVKRK